MEGLVGPPLMRKSQPTPGITQGLARDSAPLNPGRPALRWSSRAGASPRFPPWRRFPMGKRRTVTVAVRVSPTEFADRRAMAVADRNPWPGRPVPPRCGRSGRWPRPEPRSRCSSGSLRAAPGRPARRNSIATDAVVPAVDRATDWPTSRGDTSACPPSSEPGSACFRLGSRSGIPRSAGGTRRRRARGAARRGWVWGDSPRSDLEPY